MNFDEIAPEIVNDLNLRYRGSQFYFYESKNIDNCIYCLRTMGTMRRHVLEIARQHNGICVQSINGYLSDTKKQLFDIYNPNCFELLYKAIDDLLRVL